MATQNARKNEGEDTVVEVEGRRLRLRRLEKVLYPSTGTTKAEVLTYVTTVAPALLAQLHQRPLTRKRWPDGVASSSFFEKNVPRGMPDWVRTVELDAPGSTKNREKILYPLVEDLAGLVWLVNLAALELHVRSGASARAVASTTPTASSSTSTRARAPASPSARRWRSRSANVSPTTGWSASPSRPGRRGCSSTHPSAGSRTPTSCAPTPTAWRRGWRRTVPTSSSAG